VVEGKPSKSVEGGVGFAAEGALDGSALRGHWGVW